MGGIDERGERGLCGVIPFTGDRFAAGVLRGGDDFEVPVTKFSVNILPAWQIEAASSPGGPGDHQRLLAAETGKVHGTAQAIWQSDVGSDA